MIFKDLYLLLNITIKFYETSEAFITANILDSLNNTITNNIHREEQNKTKET